MYLGGVLGQKIVEKVKFWDSREGVPTKARVSGKIWLITFRALILFTSSHLHYFTYVKHEVTTKNEKWRNFFHQNHLRMSETRLLRRFRCWLEDKFQMNYTLQDINTVLFSVSFNTKRCTKTFQVRSSDDNKNLSLILGLHQRGFFRFCIANPDHFGTGFVSQFTHTYLDSKGKTRSCVKNGDRLASRRYSLKNKLGDRMIKQLLNSVLAKYRDLSVASRIIVILNGINPEIFANAEKSRLVG